MEHVKTRGVDGTKLSFEEIMIYNKGLPMEQREERIVMPENREELKVGVAFGNFFFTV